MIDVDVMVRWKDRDGKCEKLLTHAHARVPMPDDISSVDIMLHSLMLGDVYRKLTSGISEGIGKEVAFLCRESRDRGELTGTQLDKLVKLITESVELQPEDVCAKCEHKLRELYSGGKEKGAEEDTG